MVTLIKTVFIVWVAGCMLGVVLCLTLVMDYFGKHGHFPRMGCRRLLVTLFVATAMFWAIVGLSAYNKIKENL
jgi:hypothetical protein